MRQKLRSVSMSHCWRKASMAFSFTVLFALITGAAFAQKTITGKVVDDKGNPVFSANVVEKGTTNGTTTGMDGTFELEVSDEAKALKFSFVGFKTKTVQLKGRTEINVTMSSSVELDEVVVTALGVKREEKSLGYSVQKVDGKDISEVKTDNVVNQLAGRSAGVNIVGSANGPTASANVVIRGQTSLTGNNQALFVVNGVPITNGMFSSGDGLNGSSTIDFGNAAQVINPDNIESMSVLKGPAAAALYGTRASNGVILITTKDGSEQEGWNVNVTSNTTFSSVLKLPNYQNEYGFGGYGKYSYLDGANYTSATVEQGNTGNTQSYDFYDAFGENWGPRTNGQMIKQYNQDPDERGTLQPFEAEEDNIRDFYRLGVDQVSSFSISNNQEKGNFRFGYTNKENRGILPNTGLQRHYIDVGGDQHMFDDRFHVGVDVSYANSNSDNVPNAGYDESSSVMYNWLWFPRTVHTDELTDYWKPGQEDRQQENFEELWSNNPWLVVEENTNSFQNHRVYGNARMSFDITDKLNIRFRSGADINNERRQFRRAFSTKQVLNGSYREDILTFTETNNELLLSYDDLDYDRAFNFGVKLGGNIMQQQTRINRTRAPQLLIPGIYNLSNARGNVIADQFVYDKQINSVFGVANLSYQNFLFLDITGRNDWSSTLPEENNSFFYPSVSLSGVLNEALTLPKEISFLKLRAAYAQVGGDTDPYNLRNTYQYGSPWGSSAIATVNPNLNNPNLKPERTTSYEAGVDIRLFEGRLGLDATVYQMNSTDQILNVPVATSSGYTSRLTNAGEIENKGFEIVLHGEPVRTKDFTWGIDVNTSRNRATVVELADGIDNYQIVPNMYPADNGLGLSFEARPGELLGQMVGLGFKRHDGEIIHEDGLPVLTTEKVSNGTFQPDLLLSINQNFKYKQWNLNVLVDGRIGGKIYSRTHAMLNTGGSITNEDDPNGLDPLEGREEYDLEYDQYGYPVWNQIDSGSFIGDGVTLNDNGEYVQNTERVSTRDYFYAYYGNGFRRDNIEAATYDATYFKLRQVSLSYTFKPEQLKADWVNGLTVGVYGRNLLLWSKVPSIDPETYSIRNGRIIQGFESTSLPSVRSYGFRVSANF
ncbi:SusC/RagA family TonB-linked outer membrane protein [Salibacter halophilus]|uniref:SusC/RagA family TonB-linked outer membrane protein n=1 Tax=Salibacter halophilus TaxID=1803916 RepID=A0A6N6M562_9FLAO|nr:SusC/RagA family TonB-linked outer membrane protein [Salibacter halophilus]KAB1064525.1 SusC/RagA family TonB-linked outer membrane protein [Salibacter halophilus]